MYVWCCSIIEWNDRWSSWSMDGNGACSSRSFLDRFEGRIDPLSSSLSISLSLTGSARPTTAQTAAKEVRFGVDGRAQMLMGVDKLADAVQVRLFVILLPCVYRWWMVETHSPQPAPHRVSTDSGRCIHPF